MNKYILGGGLAGMIFAYYNPEYLIVSPDLGGQAIGAFEFGPRVLEKTPETEELLKELGLSTETEKIKIGFYDNSYCDSSPAFKEKYIEKSRGKSVAEKSGMNSNKKEMEVFKISFKELSDALAKKLIARQIRNQVNKIMIRRRSILLNECNKNFLYKNIVSTIPFFIYCKLCGKKTEIEADEVCFVKLKSDFFDMQGNSFIYILNKEFYRLSMHEDYIVAEMRGNKDAEELKNIFGDSLLDFKNLRTQVVTNKVYSKNNSIRFFGRFAEQDKSILVGDLIKKAKDLNRSIS